MVEVGEVATVSLGLGLDWTPELDPAPLVSTVEYETLRFRVSRFLSLDGFFFRTFPILTEALDERPIEKEEFWCRRFDEDANGEAEAREILDGARCWETGEPGTKGS